MISITLTSGLANTLFQYASVRTFAEKRGYRFCYLVTRRTFKYRVKSFKSYIGQKLGRSEKRLEPPFMKDDISSYFILSGESFLRRSFLKIWWSLKPENKKNYFSPKREKLEDENSSGNYETFDEDMQLANDWTEFSGSFQADSYFSDNRDKIIQWFTLKKKYSTQLESIVSSLSHPIEMRCCIHVRRGDYLTQGKGLSGGQEGWALPIEYYESALKIIPDDLLFLITTDSPDYVEKHFSFIKNKIIFIDNPDAVDLHLFTQCKYNIIANSSFSWWGAWLNNYPNRFIVAPKYHLGWALQTWIPWSFSNHPKDWTYIDILSIIKKK